MADRSAVYLRNSLETGPGLAAAGYAAFSSTMATGRLFADKLAEALGPGPLVRLGGSVVVAVLGWIGYALYRDSRDPKTSCGDVVLLDLGLNAVTVLVLTPNASMKILSRAAPGSAGTPARDR